MATNVIVRGPAAAVHYGWKPDFIPASLIDGLFGLYLFGSAHKTPFPSADARSQDLGDYSLSERHLARTGTPVIDANGASLSGSNYFTCPFSGDDLEAAGGGMTLFAVANVPSANTGIIGNLTTTSIENVSLATTATRAYGGFATAQPTNYGATIPSDAYSGTGPEFLAVVAIPTSVTLYRKKPNAAMQSATIARTGVFGGSALMQIGRTPGATYVSGSTVHVAGAYSGGRSAGEVGGLQAYLAAYLATLSTPVII